MASPHLFKSLFLLSITLISIGLLSVCLVSDWWIQVDEARLLAVEQQYQAEYVRYKSTTDELEQSSQVGNFDLEVKQFVPPSPSLQDNEHGWDDVPDMPVAEAATTTEAMATTTANVATATTTSSEYGDYGLYDYNGYDDPFSEDKDGHKKIKRRSAPKGKWPGLT